MRVTHQKDFASGIVYMLFGGGTALLASGYRMGTPTSMGPGLFPFWLGVALAVTGAAITLRSLRPTETGEDSRLTRWDVRSLGIVCLAVLLFGLLLLPLGLMVSAAVLILVASLASREFNLRTTLISLAVLLVITYAVFVLGLNLQIPVWPSFL